jgi:hypothetical protein
MSDNFQSLTVVLDREYREESLQPIMAAIRMMKHVSDVELGPIMGLEAYMARSTVTKNLIYDFITLLTIASEDKGNETEWVEIKAIVDRLRKKRGY